MGVLSALPNSETEILTQGENNCPTVKREVVQKGRETRYRKHCCIRKERINPTVKRE